MKNILFSALFLFSCIVAKAQDPTILSYDWDQTPVLHKISESDQKIPELILKDKTTVEFAYNKKGDLEAYKLHHMIIRVNSDDAINNNNKIYLPYYNSSDMVKQKVRVINSKGKVITLGDSDIKESKDEETESTYRYFALEGIDLGSEIEYYFLLHSSANLTGTQITLQSAYPKKNVEFSLITPWNLGMATKSYNGLPKPVKDSVNEELNILNIHLDSIEGLKNEDFANRDANLQYLVYKLDKNIATNKRDLVRYNGYAEAIYNGVYADPESSDMKKIQKLIKDMNVSSIADPAQQIRAIEDYLKTHFQIYDAYDEVLENVSDILENKAINEFGMVKLLAHIFTILDIDHQLVLTCNRYDVKFDPDFEAYNFLETYLIYFPALDKYLTPGDQFARLGFLAPALNSNYGLFIKPVLSGNMKTIYSEVKFIDPLPYDKSTDDLYIDVDLNADIVNPVYKIHREQSGYYAQSIQMVYGLLDADRQKELRESQITFISKDADVEEVTIENGSSELFGIKPLLTNGKFSTPQFIEKAGTKYLFNIGLLIGPQAEMYQDEERKLDVENDFNRWYHRELSFVMPDGYQCTNLNDLNMDVYQEKNGERTMTFTSKYSVTGNTVKVVIDEYYKQIIWPLSEFEDFRKVINASADFNKVSLVLEPK